MKTCAIMQPTYLPWLGYFDLIRNADVFVIYDHVQFEKQSWQQRNRIRNKEGELMLTVPVLYGTGLKRAIKDVKIDHSRNVISKHLSSIKFSYGRSNNFDVVYSSIESIYQRKHEFLIDLNIDLINLGMQFLNIKKEFIFSSTLDVQGKQVEALIDICKKVQADHYLSPVGAKIYIDENNLFPQKGIELRYQTFQFPSYQQVNYPNFISHLSFVDYLFNVSLSEVSDFGSFQFHTNNI